MAYKNTQHAIYEIRNLLNGKRYVGSAVNISKRWWLHKSHLKLGMHHSTYLQHAWNKHGSDAFRCFILELVKNPSNLLSREQAWIDKLQAANRRSGYNIFPTAGSSFGFKMSPESRARCSLASAGRNHSLEARARMSVVAKARGISDKTRAKMVIARTGVKAGPHSAEWNAKISAAHKGKALSAEHIASLRGRKMPPRTAEHRANQSLGMMGHIINPETRAKIGAANKGKIHSKEFRERIRARMTGRKFSQEHRAKISAALVGNKNRLGAMHSNEPAGLPISRVTVP